MAAVIRHDGKVIHPEGRKLLVRFGILCLLGAVATNQRFSGWQRIYWWFWWLALYGLVLQFFRSPGSSTPADNSLIISPAFGRIVQVQREPEEEVLHSLCLRVSIFLSVLDPHLTRSPIGGRVTYERYHPGRYLVALHPKSSTLNERSSILIEDQQNRKVLIRQIAGFLARRICTYAHEGSELSAGDEIGFIKFGSRVDLCLPPDCEVLGTVGQHVRAGETPIARFPSSP